MQNYLNIGNTIIFCNKEILLCASPTIPREHSGSPGGGYAAALRRDDRNGHWSLDWLIWTKDVKVFFWKPGCISHIILTVYIPNLTKTPLKERKLYLGPCKILSVVPVVDGRNSRLEAHHHLDNGTSKVFNGTKSSTLEIPTYFVVAKRPGHARWPVAIAS